MKLLSEIRFLCVSILIFMFITIISVFYLYYTSKANLYYTVTDNSRDSLIEQNSQVLLNDNGRILFKTNCSRCHYTTEKKFVGPGLKGIMDRISKDQFISWVNDPAKTRKKDKYFQNLFEAYNETTMPSFPDLSTEEVELILKYIDQNPTSEVVARL